MVAGKPLVSVIAPAYNEKAFIESFVAEVMQQLAAAGCSFEILIVDDGSTDGTAQILRELAARVPRLRALFLDGHHGQSAALEAGVSRARGDFLALIDADLQDDPADLEPMLRVLRSSPGCAGVVGVRDPRCDRRPRRLSSRLARWLATRIIGAEARCGLALFRAVVLRRVPFFRGAHRFLGALARIDGAAVVEMTVNHRPRPHTGASAGGWRRLFGAVRDALGVRWLIDRRLRHGIREAEPPAHA